MKHRYSRSVIPFVSLVLCHATLHADIALPVGQTIIDTTGDPALGIITRVTGATAFFNNSATATATGTPIANGIFGPWAFIGTGSSSRYATLDGSNNVVGYTGGTASNSTTAWGGSIPSGGTGTINYDMGGSGTLGQTGLLRNINTLRYTGTGATQTSNTGGAAGGDIFSANGIMNAGSGLLTIGGGANGLNILIGANRELVVAAISADISLVNILKNNSGGASVLTKTGANRLTLSGANTYTGGTFVNQGTVAIGNNSGFGTGSVAIANGATVSNSATLSGLANTFTGSGSFTTETGQTTITGIWSGFSGTVTTAASADLVFNGPFNSGVSDTTSANAAYVNNYNLNNTNGMIVQNSTLSAVTYKLGSYASAVGSNLRNSGSATGGVIFEIGNLGTNTTVAGTIGGGAQTISLKKVGSGSLTLGGSNTYIGATTVSVGTLLVTGALGASAVTVEGAAIVGGTGSLGGSLHFDANSFLTIPDLNDALSVTGTVTFGSGFGIDNLLGINWGTLDLNTPYTLLTNATDFSAAGLDHFGIANAYNVGGGRSAYFQSGSLQVVVIPEPRAALLGGLGMLALLRRRRA